MIYLVLIIFGLVVPLIIPCLIVGLWKKRHKAAFITASVLLITTLAVPGIIKTQQAMMIYGTSDPQLFRGGIAQAFMEAIIRGLFYIPVLFLFQYLVLRSYRKRQGTNIDLKETFE